ncbi:MAG: ABC transporter ATP-binding protein, partial [Candidatus Adiutrix sp.]|nr:ABC transporter ATP-binding protein [Candidatus Adiutrix sp.]
DIAHNIKMLKTLREKSKHCSALVALHDLNLGLRYFDHILLLSRGVILYSGPPDELFHNNLLDRAFGVKFLRIATENGHFLYPEPSGTPL